MKKYIILFVTCLILFSSMVEAESDLGQIMLQNWYDSYNITIPFDGTYGQSNSDRYNQFVSFWQSNSDKHCITFLGDSGILRFSVVNSYEINGNTITVNAAYLNEFYSNGGYIIQPAYNTTLTFSDYSSDSLIDWGVVDDVLNPVNYDDVYYNPIIPTPNFSIKNFIHLNDYSIDYTMLVSDQSLSIDGHPLYIMSMIYFYVPLNVYINYESYSPSNYQKGGPFYIADYEDLELVNYQSYDLDNRFHSDYQAYYESIANNRNVSSPSSMSAGTLLQRTNQFIDDAAKGIPYMGNGLEVWARYFYIDDGVIYAGDWKKWNSYRYREYERVVAEEEDAPSKGISQTINDNNPNTDGDTYNPIGVQTGNVSQTVNVNTSVPNYPDYPTINSFNKDNALVQVIDAASYMADPQNGFFDQFGLFLSNIFKFIPDEIWFVIGTGFSVSIFVMFLKIL